MCKQQISYSFQSYSHLLYYMQLSFIEQIERGQDLQSIIRENQLLRAANKKISQMIRYLIDAISKKMQQISPTFNPNINFTDIMQATADFLTAIDQGINFSFEKQQSDLHLALQEQRSINLGFQQKISEYQKTISEMSLIIQRIQLQLQDKKQENDSLKLTIAKLKINLQAVEQSQIKWQSRYELVKNQIEYSRRFQEIDLLEKNRDPYQSKFRQ